MSLRRLSVIVIIGFGILVALYFFTPLEFYVTKYSNRILSKNPIPVAQREKEIVDEYDWTLKSFDGELLNLEDHKGKVIVINFWATWCPPCIEELPSLQGLYNDYSDKVTFLFVARDKENRVATFLSKKDYNIPVYFERGLTPKLFYYPSIPSTYIIGKKGVIEMAKTGSYDWNSNPVRELLDNLLKQ
ncbi:MAG: TlpA family protein disulfide reductase [Eudoraea sp.]|nr:TlpA family protein disulfide reductase [Eudoraea sp.]